MIYVYYMEMCIPQTDATVYELQLCEHLNNKVFQNAVRLFFLFSCLFSMIIHPNICFFEGILSNKTVEYFRDLLLSN